MEQKTIYLKDMISPIITILEDYEYDKHALWGNMYNDFSFILRFHKEAGIKIYNPEVTEKYVNTVYSMYKNGEKSRSFYLKIRKAAERLDEFYFTGTLNIVSNKKQSKFTLSEKNEDLLNTFLSSNDFHLNTKWDFAWVIRKYLHYFEQKGIYSIKKISINDIRQFIVDTASSISPGSLHNTFCYLRRFYEYLNEIDIEIPKSISLFSYRIPRKTSVRNPITDNEMSLIKEQIDTSTDLGKRDMAIISLGETTGLRAIDIVNLKLSNIDWLNGEIRITQTKTQNPLSLPLLPETGKYLKDYILNARKKSDFEEVFLRDIAPFRPISAVTVAYAFNKYCEKAGILREKFDGKGFHSLRYRLAKNLLTSGTPMTTISQILGHTNIDTTNTYLSLNSQNLKECSLDFSIIPLERGELI